MREGFTNDPGAITALLKRQAGGDPRAERELFVCVYETLHAMAARRLQSERPDHTIQPTALIHEVYLALSRAEGVDWADRGHFFALAARAMRRILVDYGRRRGAAKRADGLHRVELGKAQVFSLDDPDFIIALDKALDRLREESERACRVVELRAFVGLSMEDIASSLGVSPRTVKRDWYTGRVRLYQHLYGHGGANPE